MNFRIIPATNSGEWHEVLRRVDHYDLYHTASYSSLDTFGEARLLVFEEKEKLIAVPLIFRDIPHTDLKDVTSVYGYAGWVRNEQHNFPELFSVLKEYFRKEKIVSAFSRIHPLVPGAGLFEKGEIIDLNTTLAIDLQSSEDFQWRSYSESVRRTIKRSKQNGLSVRRTESEKDILSFASIYRDAMHLLNAAPFYYFSDDYFLRLMRSSEYDAFVLLAEVDGQLAGGALFTVCNEYMQYHLGAVVERYHSYSPLKLLINEARKIGNLRQLQFLHLGGGLGGVNDNLFVFKSRMASLKYIFKVWKWIVDEENYILLSEGKAKSSYFPLYRAK